MRTLRALAFVGAWVVAAAGVGAAPEGGPAAADEILRQNPQLKALPGIPPNLKGANVQACPSSATRDFSRNRCVVAYVPPTAPQMDMTKPARVQSFVLVLHPESSKVWTVLQVDPDDKSKSTLLGQFDLNGGMVAKGQAASGSVPGSPAGRAPGAPSNTDTNVVGIEVPANVRAILDRNPQLRQVQGFPPFKFAPGEERLQGDFIRTVFVGKCGDNLARLIAGVSYGKAFVKSSLICLSVVTRGSPNIYDSGYDKEMEYLAVLAPESPKVTSVYENNKKLGSLRLLARFDPAGQLVAGADTAPGRRPDETREQCIARLRGDVLDNHGRPIFDAVGHQSAKECYDPKDALEPRKRLTSNPNIEYNEKCRGPYPWMAGCPGPA